MALTRIQTDALQSSITGSNIVDGSIVAADLASGSVTPAKLSTGGPSWDSSGNVGVGTGSPAYKLDVQGGNIRNLREGSQGGLQLFTYSSNQPYNAPRIETCRARGTLASPSVVTSGDELFSIQNSGWNANGGWTYTGGIFMYATATITGGNVPSYLTFETNSGSSGTERMRIDANGNVSIGSGVNTGYARFAVNATSLSSYPTYTNPSSGGFNGNFIASTLNSADTYTTMLDLGAVTANTDAQNGGSAIRFLTQPRVTPFAPSERMRITGAGNVLIGTTAASGTLNSSSQPRLIVGNSGNGGFGAIYGVSGGGTTYFPVNNGFGYRVTIWSTQSSINAKIGVYIFVGLNKGAGYNPVILTVNTVNSPDWSFSYALLNSNDCTVGVNDGGGNQGTRVVVENLGNV